MSAITYIMAIPLAALALDALIRAGGDDPEEWRWWAKVPLVAVWPVFGALCYVAFVAVALGRVTGHWRGDIPREDET